MKTELLPMEPFGRTLLDCYEGKTDVAVHVHRNDGLASGEA